MNRTQCRLTCLLCMFFIATAYFFGVMFTLSLYNRSLDKMSPSLWMHRVTASMTESYGLFVCFCVDFGVYVKQCVSMCLTVVRVCATMSGRNNFYMHTPVRFIWTLFEYESIFFFKPILHFVLLLLFFFKHVLKYNVSHLHNYRIIPLFFCIIFTLCLRLFFLFDRHSYKFGACFLVLDIN